MMSPILLTLLLLFALTSHAATFQQGSTAQDAMYIPTAQVLDIEIDNHMVRHSLSDSMQQTLDLIKNVESLPSCAKIASSALLHSCSALEGSITHDDSDLRRGSDLFVEEEADIYSARLAVCELSGADFSIPSACQSFIPTEKSKNKRGIRGFWSKNGPSQPATVFQYYDDVTLNNLQQCRKSLGSTSQSWTSYSNNRQNAVVMCRAMQSQVDNDEHIHVAKVLASAAASATVSLQDTSEAINTLKMQFNELATGMPQFHKDLAAGKEMQLKHVQNFWAEVERAQKMLRQVLNDANDLGDGVRKSKKDVTDLVSAIRKAAADSTSGVHEITALNEASAYRMEQFQQDMIKSLYQVTKDMGVVNAFIPTLNGELTTFHKASQLVHQDMLNKQKENREHLDQTAATLDQFNQAALEMNSTLASISGFVGIGWPRVMDLLKTTATFTGYTFIYTFVSFGLWEKYGGLYVMGTTLASTATGTTLGFISTYYLSPVKLADTTVKFFSEMIIDSQLILGGLLGVLTCGIIGAVGSTVRHITRKRTNCIGKYDPASPPYSPALHSKAASWL